MGQTISNTPDKTPVGPSTDRTLTNGLDVGRRYSENDLVPEIVTETELDDTVGDQFRRGDTQIQFNPRDPDAFAASLPSATVVVAVTDGQGIIDSLSDVVAVQVDINSGTAAGKKLRANGKVGTVDGSLIVTLVNGKVEVDLVPTGNGTFVVGLDNAFNNALINSASGRVFDTTDTATATFA